MRDGTIRPELWASAAAPADIGYHRFAELDREQAEAMVRRFYSPVQLDVEADQPFRMSGSVLRLGPLTVGHLTFQATTTLNAAAIDGYHVSVPLTGEVRTRHSGAYVVARPATVAPVYRAGTPAATTHEAGTSELRIKLDEGALESELEAMLDRPVQGRIDFAPAMDVTAGPGRTWAELMRLLRDESRDSTGLIYQPLVAERLWRSVLTGLLLAAPHRFSDDLTRPVRPGPPRAVRRVVEAIQAEPHRPFTVKELAVLGEMSVRSLQEGFRRHVGATPMGYLQQVRLSHCHETLRHADPHSTTVAAVAHRWGFTHLGRFAQSYRARYGVHPSATLRADS
jgi:AraC-like DNA-binding protein